MIKVIHVIRPAAGGMRSHLLKLVRGLAHCGFQPVVACPPAQDLRLELEQLKIPFYPVPLPGEVAPLLDIQAVCSLARTVRQQKCLLIHGHGIKAGVLAYLAARFSGTGGKVLCTVHGAFPAASGKSAAGKCLRLGAGMALRLMDHIIAVSEHTREELIDGYGLHPGQVTTIYNGVEEVESPFAYLSPLRVETRPVIGVVARLAPQKGLDVFLKAARLVLGAYPGARFLIVGDGPLWPALRERAGELGLAGRVVFTGRISRAQRLLPLLDVFVLPSLDEGLPLALLEAMACALPVVATGVGGIPEVVTKEAGILVPPGEAEALAAGIGAVLENRSWARQMGNNAKCRVMNLFSTECMISQTATLYRAVLASQRQKKYFPAFREEG